MALLDDAIERFAQALGDARPANDDWKPRLADVIARVAAAGSPRYVRDADLVAFAASLAAHAKSNGDVAAYLEGARAEDLALAWACAQGDGRALATFERLYFSEIDRALSKVRRGAVDAQDLAQLVRQRLFVATEERRPRIADYAGQGDLRTWFRVAVTRLLTNEVMRPKRDEATEDEQLAQVATDAADPELELLRRKYAEEFKASFARALAALESRDRAILQYTVVERLGIDALAEIYDVHRATAARWVQRAREALISGVRADLEAHLKVAPQELESILRVIADDVDVSVRRLL